MKNNYEKALPLFLRYEGGYVNDPDDPGGATNKGITQVTYNAYRTSNGKIKRSVKFIEDKEVSDIYKKHYWDKLGGDSLEWPLSLVAVDTAINCGPSRAIRWLEAAKGSLDERIASVILSRRQHYKRIIAANPKLVKFKKGWENRVKDLEKEVGL